MRRRRNETFLTKTKAIWCGKLAFWAFQLCNWQKPYPQLLLLQYHWTRRFPPFQHWCLNDRQDPIEGDPKSCYNPKQHEAQAIEDLQGTTLSAGNEALRGFIFSETVSWLVGNKSYICLMYVEVCVALILQGKETFCLQLEAFFPKDKLLH